MLVDSQQSASRISCGAAAAPRLYEEFSSRGTPSKVGAPQGPFALPELAMGTPLHLTYTFRFQVRSRIRPLLQGCRRGSEQECPVQTSVGGPLQVERRASPPDRWARHPSLHFSRSSVFGNDRRYLPGK